MTTEETNAPDASGVVAGDPTDRVEPPVVEAATGADEAGVEAGGEPSEAGEVKEDKTDPAIKLEILKEREAKRSALDEAEYWRKQAEANREPAAVAQEVKGKPQEDDYDTNAEYVEALTKHTMDEQRETYRAEDAKTAIADTNARNMDDYNAGIGGAIEKYPDYAEVERIANSACSNELGNEVVKSESKYDIAYYFGNHPTEARRISKLSPVDMARELGKLEAKLEGKKTPEQKKVTAAKDPGASLAGAGTSAAGGSPNETTAEYVARVNAEEDATWKEAQGG